MQVVYDSAALHSLPRTVRQPLYAEGFSCWFKLFPLLILVILVLHLFVLLSYWPFSDFSARTLQHITCASYFLHCNVNSSTELFSCLCPDPAAQSKLDLGRMVFACTLNVWVCVISCQWVESATKGKQMG